MYPRTPWIPGAAFGLTRATNQRACASRQNLFRYSIAFGISACRFCMRVPGFGCVDENSGGAWPTLGYPYCETFQAQIGDGA